MCLQLTSQDMVGRSYRLPVVFSSGDVSVSCQKQHWAVAGLAIDICDLRLSFGSSNFLPIRTTKE